MPVGWITALIWAINNKNEHDEDDAQFTETENNKQTENDERRVICDSVCNL